MANANNSTSNRTREVVLYTRKKCHLCDNAKDILERYGLEPYEVEIDREPGLLERFDTCVPVVEIDGKIRFRGRINETLLKRLLTSRD